MYCISLTHCLFFSISLVTLLSALAHDLGEKLSCMCEKRLLVAALLAGSGEKQKFMKMGIILDYSLPSCVKRKHFLSGISI